MKVTPVASNKITIGAAAGGDAGGTLPGNISVEKVNGLPPSWKNPVRAATTTAITLFTDLQPGDTIDGVTLVDQDRVLVKNQSSPDENGIYIVGSSIRSPDMDESDEVVGAAVYVAEGTTNAATIWINTNTTPPVIDTDAITFAQFNTASGSLGSITDGITTVAPVTTLTVEPHSLSGTTPNASHAVNRLVTVADAGSAYEFDLANGNVFDLTLTEDCDLTIAAGAVSGYPDGMRLIVRSNGFAVTWPASVGFPADDGTLTGPPPTLHSAPGSQDVVLLESFDGGVTWGGFHLNPAATGAMVPYLIESGETFTVPVKKQALKAMPITVDAGGSLVVDGYLLEVA